jgi:RNA polymerase sigma-70 factor (ECF subfamily)
MESKIKILEQLQKGKKKALKKIFVLYFPRLEKYACQFIANQQEAEDLVQEVFIQVWENRKTIQPHSNFDSYLFTLVRNRCLNALKKRAVEKGCIEKMQADSEELYAISFEAEEGFISMGKRLHEELENTIAEMPGRCQTAFRLKWIEGKKIREIAEVMNISTTMVDKHLAKGMDFARKKLSREMFLFLCFFQSGSF